MAKKITSIALALLVLIGTFTVAASAASYSKGYYEVAASNGSNVRTGAGTGYSRVGAASNGVRFYVSKISGSWGYTSSIKCTNGTKSGWICLDYCRYKGSGSNSRASYNDVFASVKGQGYSLSQARSSQATTFNKGTFVYVWAYVHDVNNNLYKSYGSGTCNMTLSIYRPDGSCAYTYTYKNSDNNWIGQKLDQAGTWKIQSKITGSLSGTNTRTITVKESSTTTYYTLSYNANGGSSAPSSQRVKANTGFNLSSTKPTRSGYTFLGWSTNKNATSASYSAGAGVRISSNITLYAVWKKNQSSVSYRYKVNVSNGVNVRSGAGSSYSKVGAAKYNTIFTVTKISGNWGYTSSIQCTNGTKSGWVCLDYCSKYSSSYKPSTTRNEVIKLNVPYYKQTDSRWKNTKIGTKTIGQVGCTTTCIAMVYSYNTGTTVHPNAVMKKLKYSNNDLYWYSIGNVGLTSVQYNSKMTNNILSTIYSKLKQGRPVIIGASTSKNSYQHWVVITGYTGNGSSFSTKEFSINDPANSNIKTLSAFLANGSYADRTKIIRIMY